MHPNRWPALALAATILCSPAAWGQPAPAVQLMVIPGDVEPAVNAAEPEAAPALPAPAAATAELQQLAQQAVSADQPAADAAIARLRSAGPAGLDTLLWVHRDALGLRRAGRAPADNLAWLRIAAALDAVGAQRDCYASGLYWFTDLTLAQAQARRTGKPILSLRLLGQLTDELSCANSRFFRTTLYPDQQIAQLLREQFVLYWSSERPVPVVTIDFGDGRVLTRTLTGNSVHYILDAGGHPLDAIPGLYSPAEFKAQLERGLALHQQVRDLPLSEARPIVRAHHSQRFDQLQQQWQASLAAASLPLDLAPAQATAEQWALLAAPTVNQVRFDPPSLRLIQEKFPPAQAAMELARTKAIVESPLLRMVNQLQQNVALDTFRNQHLFHAQIHRWLSDPDIAWLTQGLNHQIYARLFLTPRDDPWLGLSPADVYTALDNGGRNTSSTTALLPSEAKYD